MLTPPLRLEPPWHSKQYFWKVWGGRKVWDAGGPTLARWGAGAWAAIIDAPAKTSVPQTSKRVIGLPAPEALEEFYVPDLPSIES